MDQKDISQRTERLLGTSVLSVAAVAGGVNSRVVRATTSAGTFAVKVYPASDDGAYPRLDREFSALELLAQLDEPCVARPLVRTGDQGIGAYEWISGTAVQETTMADIDQALDFVERLRSYGKIPAAQQIGPATEACLSARDLLTQTDSRLVRLEEIRGESSELESFLSTMVRPLWRRAVERATLGFDDTGWRLDLEIPTDQRILSPSDFGFHNALRRDDGTLAFVDFEYFGWDDPVRLLSDFLLHPGMSLTEDQRRRFSTRALSLFSNPPGGNGDFPLRFDLLYPLVGLRWCAIILNEFLPEQWARRLFAQPDLDKLSVQHDQLKKARLMSVRVDEALKGYAHGK